MQGGIIRQIILIFLISLILLASGCNEAKSGSAKPAKQETINLFEPINLGAPESLEQVNKIQLSSANATDTRILIYESYSKRIREINPKTGNDSKIFPYPSPDDVFGLLSRRVLRDKTGRLINLPLADWGLGAEQSIATLWIYNADLTKEEKILTLKPGWTFSVTPSPDESKIAVSAKKITYDIPHGPFIGPPSSGNADIEIFIVDLSTAKSKLVYRHAGNFESRRNSVTPPLSWKKTGIILSIKNGIMLIRQQKQWEQRFYEIENLFSSSNVSPDGSKLLVFKGKRSDISSALLTIPDFKEESLPEEAFKPFENYFFNDQLDWSDNDHLVALEVLNKDPDLWDISLLQFDYKGKLTGKTSIAKKDLNFRSSPTLSVFSEIDSALVTIDGRAPEGAEIYAFSFKKNNIIWIKDFQPITEILGVGS